MPDNIKYQLLIIDRLCDKMLSRIEKEASASPELKTELVRAKREAALIHEASLEGCSNPELLMQALETDLNLNDFGTDADFHAIARDEIKRAKVDKDTSILFDYSDPKSNTSPSKPRAKNPFSKKKFNLTEQAKLIKNNPELAARLKAEAEAEE